jgi:starch synthase (maltosyl-transferring)
MGSLSPVIGRVPILDVQPAVDGGRRAAKAVVGETFEVSATIFGEGHDLIGAAVLLEGPQGGREAPAYMHELSPGSDRLGAEVRVSSEGLWYYHVAAWRDPIAQWRHDAEIKIPREQDVELMLAEGALLFARAARAVRGPGWGEPQPPPVRVPATGTRRVAGRAKAATSKAKAATGRAKAAAAKAKAAAAAQKLASPTAEEARNARAALAEVARLLTDPGVAAMERLGLALDPEIWRLLALYPVRDRRSRSRRFAVIVQRERALYGGWYEFFPRSEGAVVDPTGQQLPVSGTLRTAAKRLEAIADMGFDVVYLPPVHPIGFTNRKGRNNTLHPGPGDPGSPWAIGSAEGGHDAIHPDLGTFDDFDAFVGRTRELGMEVALDLALQCSPDHPWVAEHPEWFTTRADGTIAYAENPPKKYQDIYPVNFDLDPEGLHHEVLRIVRLWMDHGVRIFRVDNPHTKAMPFWERLLAEVARTDPDVVFLAEAFTRPAMMSALAMIGFHQSYTYFTWRNTADEITSYMQELAGPTSAWMRPNFFTNTPDILNEYLVHGGPPAFVIRAVLAAMLSPSWGIYSGYELCENVPVRPGSEEYMDSEKYQYRPRDWSAAYRGPGGLAPLITRLNAIRRAHPALHWLRNVRFHRCDQPGLLCFSKRVADDTVLVVVNLDPHQPREATVWLDTAALGAADASTFTVTDELSGQSYQWGRANYVRLDPAFQPAHIFAVAPALQEEWPHPG